jgi:hypothetical protein
LDRTVAELEPSLLELLVLRHFCDLDSIRIGEILALNASTVRSRPELDFPAEIAIALSPHGPLCTWLREPCRLTYRQGPARIQLIQFIAATRAARPAAEQ